MSSEQDFEKTVALLESGTTQGRAMALALCYGQIDGSHHKMWVIDQMLRILAGEGYDQLVEIYEKGGEYEWDVGITP